MGASGGLAGGFSCVVRLPARPVVLRYKKATGFDTGGSVFHIKVHCCSKLYLVNPNSIPRRMSVTGKDSSNTNGVHM